MPDSNHTSPSQATHQAEPYYQEYVGLPPADERKRAEAFDYIAQYGEPDWTISANRAAYYLGQKNQCEQYRMHTTAMVCQVEANKYDQPNPQNLVTWAAYLRGEQAQRQHIRDSQAQAQQAQQQQAHETDAPMPAISVELYTRLQTLAAQRRAEGGQHQLYREADGSYALRLTQARQTRETNEQMR